jgi:hypothetical protein
MAWSTENSLLQNGRLSLYRDKNGIDVGSRNLLAISGALKRQYCSAVLP